MTPWAVRAIDELNASDRQAEAVAGGLDADQLNWRPSPAQWSVGQCLEHLYITNEVYLPPMARALESSTGPGQAHSTGSGQGGKLMSPVEEITPGWFGRWFIRNYIDLETQRRPQKAPTKIAPAQRVETDIVAKFLRSNVVARDFVRRASAVDVNRIRFKNPFVAGIRFTVGTGVEIVWRHQRRHLLQAERVRAVFPF